MIDISLDEYTLGTLKSLIGKTLESYLCDEFVFSPNVFGIIGFCIDGNTYKLTCGLEAIQRFFNTDEVSVMRFAECKRSDIVSRMDGGELITNPVKDIIKCIDVVNDLETVEHDGNQKRLLSTKGIIFHLAGGNEISFEVSTWFSEMITVQRGYTLLNKFNSTEDFLDEWEDSEGYTPACTRKVISLK